MTQVFCRAGADIMWNEGTCFHLTIAVVLPSGSFRRKILQFVLLMYSDWRRHPQLISTSKDKKGNGRLLGTKRVVCVMGSDGVSPGRASGTTDGLLLKYSTDVQ